MEFYYEEPAVNYEDFEMYETYSEHSYDSAPMIPTNVDGGNSTPMQGFKIERVEGEFKSADQAACQPDQTLNLVQLSLNAESADGSETDTLPPVAVSDDFKRLKYLKVKSQL